MGRGKDRAMTLRISAEMDSALERMAKEEEVTKSHLVRAALKKILSSRVACGNKKGCR